MRYIIAISLIVSAGCSATAAHDYRGVAAWGLAEANAKGGSSPAPDPSPAPKIRRQDCKVCGGDGLVRAPGQSFDTECVNCAVSQFTRPAPATSNGCLCINCPCKPAAVGPSVVSPPLPPKPPAATSKVQKSVVNTAPKKSYTYSGSCANGQCSTSRGFVRRGRR